MDILRFHPTVYAVGEEYQIFAMVNRPCVLWIKIGDECYFDHSNGILSSGSLLHKVTVPMERLDREKKYVVCTKEVIERKPYFSNMGESAEIEYNFKPVSDLPIRIYQIADAHGLVEAPIESAKNFEREFGRIDVLVFNGDVIEHSGDLEKFNNYFAIASAVCRGNIPTVFSRGNHDTRGIYAERLADYSPTNLGRSYYSFKLGPLWGLVLDCAEDKPDSHPEYAGTVVCEHFRKQEGEYIKDIIKRKKQEYASDGVKKRIIICHHPFTKRMPEPFNIEEDTYSLWAKTIKKSIEPDVMISGHLHKVEIALPDSEADVLGHPCPIVIGSLVNRNEKTYLGSGVILYENEILAAFSSETKVIKTVLIKKGNDSDE